jgi:hypothetical protein
VNACYCGGLYRCDTCRLDVCYCPGHTDPTPDTREAVTSGYVNPTQARLAAWQERQDLRR